MFFLMFFINQVVVGGVIDTICFDKTGTLTQDGMNLKGILPCITDKKFMNKIIDKKKIESALNED